MASARQRRLGMVVLAVTAALALGACSNKHATSSGAAGSGAPTTTVTVPAPTATTPTTPAVPPAALRVSPASGATAVSPISAITAAVTGGTLTSVKLVNPAEGRVVAGSLSANKQSWKATEPLGYGKTYRLTATATNSDGQPVTRTSTFSTLAPQTLTMPSLDYTGGYGLTNGATYGVGIVPVVHFDESISDKAAAERALHVTTTPHVNGAWYWADDQNIHFRPASFWPSGTKVTVSANLYGVQVGPGLYGQSDVSTSFTIGRKQLTVAYDNAPNAVNKVNVYNAAGQLLRSMNTSMGEHSGVTVNGNYISFYTMNGTYTVLEHDNPAMMSSASYGLPANAPGGYGPEPIYYSTKISTDGIYLHELDNTVWAQDNGEDVSHGCLNLNHDNAVWFYNNSMIGDPVIIHGTQGAPNIQLYQGGDWSIPWSTWLKGSAL